MCEMLCRVRLRYLRVAPLCAERCPSAQHMSQTALTRDSQDVTPIQSC